MKTVELIKQVQYRRILSTRSYKKQRERHVNEIQAIKKPLLRMVIVPINRPSLHSADPVILDIR